MPSKKNKQKKKHNEANAANHKPTESPVMDSTVPKEKAPLEDWKSVEAELDAIAEGDRLKEKGNEAFKLKHYYDAIAWYTKAHELRPTEPTYLTNRAASYMGLKFFRQALADCQNAAALQSASPVPKTLVRLARCHLALGSPNPALSAAHAALAIDSTITAAKEVERAAQRMESHLARVTQSRTKKDWVMARLALDQAANDADGTEPIEWQCWRIEIELARGKLEQALLAANQAFQLEKNSPEVLCLRGLVLFLNGKLPMALQHAQQALTYDPEHKQARQLMRRIKSVERIKDEGNTSFKSGQLPEAVEKYTEALELVGQREEEANGGVIRSTLLSNRAAALLKLNRDEEALADTNASLDLVSTSYKALRTRARIHLLREDYEAAISDFKASLEHVRLDGSEAEERALKQELKSAEVALKRSKSKDYYKILGVQKDCTEVDIKKAYRKMSLLHHPDKGGDEEKFKLASEAYSVLSDPNKRSRYDAGEDDENVSGMGEADLANLFAAFGAGGATFSFGSSGGGFSGSRFSNHGGHPGFSF